MVASIRKRSNFISVSYEIKNNNKMNIKENFAFNLPDIDSLTNSFWKAKPFPFVVIDNFLNEDDFKILSDSVLEFASTPDYEFKNNIEGGKSIYSNNNSPELVQKFVNTVSSDSFITKLCSMTGAQDIISLVELSDEHDAFRYFHEMKDGGILGAHVDHSMIKDNVHFLNSLFYITPEWSEKWGGSTQFYKYYGLKFSTEVEYKPNRLILFLHSSKSFHKVSRIKNNKINRFSVYMDYYTHKDKLNSFIETARNERNFSAKFWRHQTTFVPTFKQFLNSFINRNKSFNRPYVYVFLKYLAKKYLRKI